MWCTNQASDMKYSEITRRLKSAGCYIKKEGSNHTLWYSPITGRMFPVSRHKSEEAKRLTLKSISEQSGVNF